MEWTLHVRPWTGVAPLVEQALTMSTSTVVRNFRIHMTQPDAMVQLKPPRGRTGGQVWGQVRLDTWLGGVLVAHLQDSRSTVDQSRPRWGFS